MLSADNKEIQSPVPKVSVQVLLYFSVLLTLDIYCITDITFMCSLISDNVELILKSVPVRHCSESQDNDQPDYDSVASDEDTDQELPPSKGDRTKVFHFL